ncbi:hypothetical protein [Actinoplanes sp. NPDC051851]|uniref:hypothetical protein n=1 Tax=Actinoplanes sp. NPDC051851 TaxID=3154753 RepID=UPI003435D860
MAGISFHLNERGLVDYRADKRFTVLGLWLTGDIQASLSGCLDLLADLADLGTGRPTEEEWEGNAFSGILSVKGLQLQNDYLPAQKAEYSLDEVRPVVDDYWRFIAGPQDTDTAVLAWERDNGRTHPRRGSLL